MDVTREELPDTMAAVRLSGMEISDLTMELSDLGLVFTCSIKDSHISSLFPFPLLFSIFSPFLIDKTKNNIQFYLEVIVTSCLFVIQAGDYSRC